MPPPTTLFPPSWSIQRVGGCVYGNPRNLPIAAAGLLRSGLRAFDRCRGFGPGGLLLGRGGNGPWSDGCPVPFASALELSAVGGGSRIFGVSLPSTSMGQGEEVVGLTTGLGRWDCTEAVGRGGAVGMGEDCVYQWVPQLSCRGYVRVFFENHLQREIRG
jgi:hypothetical protein